MLFRSTRKPNSRRGHQATPEQRYELSLRGARPLACPEWSRRACDGEADRGGRSNRSPELVEVAGPLGARNDRYFRPLVSLSLFLGANTMLGNGPCL